ncbi:MAG: type II toxin-antitoxin system RelE/ParE family toxin [Deltaproteobacteria bacterium]|nr:type II toxin-antitoxin system RelE/ParE family toxin [Deltaproteobacteria bacterium]
MKFVQFIKEARNEFLAEVAYYHEAGPGLAERFTAAIEEATARALAFPQAGSPSFSKTRRVFTKGFPFSVIYRQEKKGIIVFAVAHHAQKPGYWRSRLETR